MNANSNLLLLVVHVFFISFTILLVVQARHQFIRNLHLNGHKSAKKIKREHTASSIRMFRWTLTITQSKEEKWRERGRKREKKMRRNICILSRGRIRRMSFKLINYFNAKRWNENLRIIWLVLINQFDLVYFYWKSFSILLLLFCRCHQFNLWFYHAFFFGVYAWCGRW